LLRFCVCIETVDRTQEFNLESQLAFVDFGKASVKVGRTVLCIV